MSDVIFEKAKIWTTVNKNGPKFLTDLWNKIILISEKSWWGHVHSKIYLRLYKISEAWVKYFSSKGVIPWLLFDVHVGQYFHYWFGTILRHAYPYDCLAEKVTMVWLRCCWKFLPMLQIFYISWGKFLNEHSPIMIFLKLK